MKKIFTLFCIATLLFVGTAFSEPIEFPNGIIVDVAPGWSYEGEEDRILLVAEDESCAIAIIVSDAKGITSIEEAAKTMSEELKGSEPTKIGDDTYLYSFLNEAGVETKVFVGLEDEKLKILSITGEHKDVEDMVISITEKK
jgi:hypothetical protein